LTNSSTNTPNCSVVSPSDSLVDGNKRVAVATAAAFLRVNGYQLVFGDTEAFSFLVGLYESGNFGFKELEVWLRQHAVPAEPSM